MLCLRIAACDGFPDNEAVRWLTFPINDPNFPNFEVIQHRRRLVIDDAHVSYPHFVEDVERYQTHNIRSFCCLPLVHRGEVIGMVAIGKSTPGYYTAERADLAEVIAGAGASAVSNARFVKEVAEKAKAFLTLMQTSAALIRGHRPEALYRFYAQAGVEVFNVEVCSIYLWNEQDKQYTLAAAAGQEPSDHTLDVQARAVFAGAVANSGHSLNLSGKSLQQAYADNGYDADEQAHLLSGRAQSLLIGPIFDSNSTHIGAVVLENQRGENKESGFGPFYLELLEGFAIQLVLPLATIDASRRARDSLNDDLHDMMNFVHGTLVQTTAYLQTKLAPTLIGEDLAELKRIHRAAKYVYHGIRRINDDVRDPIIQERGLVEALRQYSNLFFDRVKVDIIEKGTLRLPSDIGYALYRIGQETLHNISKHAQLSPIDGRVLIVLSESDGQYQLCIEDNGIGFPADRGTPPPESYGLLSIGRWCELIGARLQIYQRPGNGVGVSIEGELRKETIWVSASGF